MTISGLIKSPVNPISDFIAIIINDVPTAPDFRINVTILLIIVATESGRQRCMNVRDGGGRRTEVEGRTGVEGRTR